MSVPGITRYRVRYQYKKQTGIKTNPETGEKSPVFKSVTSTRNVEINGEADEKTLTSVLEDSHRKEQPLGLKVLGFQKVENPASPTAQSTVDEGTKQTVSELKGQVAELTKRVAALETQLSELTAPEKKSGK